MPATEIGKRMKFAFKRLGVNNRDVASTLGVTPSTISNVITGRYNPNNVVAGICRYYGVSAKWIFDGVGDMFEKDAPTSIGANAVGHDDMSINKGNPDILIRAIDEIGQLRILLDKSIENNKQQATQFLSIINNLTRRQ